MQHWQQLAWQAGLTGWQQNVGNYMCHVPYITGDVWTAAVTDGIKTYGSVWDPSILQHENHGCIYRHGELLHAELSTQFEQLSIML